MTDEEIKDLANEAGAEAVGLNVESASVLALFKQFARAIESRTWTDTKVRWYQKGVEAEREACAKLVEKSYGGWTTKMLVMAIRARGE